MSNKGYQNKAGDWKVQKFYVSINYPTEMKINQNKIIQNMFTNNKFWVLINSLLCLSPFYNKQQGLSLRKDGDWKVKQFYLSFKYPTEMKNNQNQIIKNMKTTMT